MPCLSSKGKLLPASALVDLTICGPDVGCLRLPRETMIMFNDCVSQVSFYYLSIRIQAVD